MRQTTSVQSAPSEHLFAEFLGAVRTTAARQSGGSRVAYDHVCSVEVRRIAVALPAVNALAFVAYCRSNGCAATDEVDASIVDRTKTPPRSFVYA